MKKYLLLAMILVLALTLRFYNLSDFRCLNWDEAAFGYNAYSIVKTGADEYGAKLPLQFKSVGDYKAPLYIYLMAPVIKIFGLSEFSVRFLPALLGSLSIIVFYFLIKEIFENEKLSLLAAFFLAISPWHIQFTKAGADVGVATFFILLGIFGFIKGAKGVWWGYYMASAGFVFSIFGYFAERLFVPLISIFLLYNYRKEVVKTQGNFILGIILGAILITPIIPSLLSGGHQEKILKTTVFGYQRSETYINQIIKEDKSKVFYYFYHTAVFENTWTSVNHYLNHFSPSFLFFDGVNFDPRQQIVRMGVLHLFDLPLILVGIYSLIKRNGKVKYLILGWLLLAPVASAITKDTLSARRSLDMIYPLLIISAYGALKIWEKSGKFLKVVFIGILGYSVLFYLASYYVFTPPLGYAGPAGWSCGYKELVSSIQIFKKEGKEMVIDTSYQGPYIFFLFYEQYNPASYQKQARLVQDSPDSLGEGAGYDNYTFRPIYWPHDRCLIGKIFAGPPERLPEQDLKKGEVEILKKVYFPDETEAFRVVKTVLSPPGNYCATIKAR